MQRGGFCENNGKVVVNSINQVAAGQMAGEQGRFSGVGEVNILLRAVNIVTKNNGRNRG